MAYNKKKLFTQAIAAIKKNKLFFIEDIIALLPCSKATFYDYFPAGSDELNELKDLLDANKINLKVSMRQKWYKSESATLQMALYKLTATPEEHKLLSMNYHETDITSKGEKLPSSINVNIVRPNDDD